MPYFAAVATTRGHVRRRRDGIDRHAQFVHEPLEPGRRTLHEHAGRARSDHPEAVRNVARTVDPGAGTGHTPRLTAEEGYGPLEDVERFVFVVVHADGDASPDGHSCSSRQNGRRWSRPWSASRSAHRRTGTGCRGGCSEGLAVLCNHGGSFGEAVDHGAGTSSTLDVVRVGLPLQRPPST